MDSFNKLAVLYNAYIVVPGGGGRGILVFSKGE